MLCAKVGGACSVRLCWNIQRIPAMAAYPIAIPRASARKMVTIRRIVIPNVIKTASPEKMRCAYPGLLTLLLSSARNPSHQHLMFGPAVLSYHSFWLV